MLNVVGKRGWYFLFSALILLPGLISLVMPPGWATGNSGLNPGIDFTSGSVLQVTFDKSVNEQQILAVYKSNNLKKRGSLNQLRPQIRKYLKGQLRQEKLLEQFLIAQEKGWITSYLSPPSQFTIRVPIKTAFIRGNSKASVMVLEFSDYQCPYCARIQRTIGVLLKKYRKTVAFGYRHFPLGFHTEADEAAISVECAREQNKFVEMHQVLYENQKAQFPENLKQYARQVGVKNIKKFNQQENNFLFFDVTKSHGDVIGLMRIF